MNHFEMEIVSTFKALVSAGWPQNPFFSGGGKIVGEGKSTEISHQCVCKAGPRMK